MRGVSPGIAPQADGGAAKAESQTALEFQGSPRDPKRLKERTKGYASLGLEVVWILGPRYYSQRPGSMQAKFLRWDQGHGYHLWYSDGRRFFELLQVRQGYFLFQRFSNGPMRERQVRPAYSKQKIVLLIDNQFHHRDAKLMAFPALASPTGEYLAGLPWSGP